MQESFGAQLRRRREELGIAIETIAQQTKIKVSLLEALERDDVSRWPSGIFRRAYLRAYAQVAGLDPDATVREFLEAHPDPASRAETDSATANGSSSSAPPTRLRYIVGSALEKLSKYRRGSTNGNGHLNGNGTPAVSRSPGGASSRATNGYTPPLLAEERGPSQTSEPAPVILVAAAEVAATEVAEVAVAEIVPVAAPAPSVLDLMAVARLCTEFSRIETTHEVQPLLQDAAEILGAVGIIVWIWDEPAEALRPALVHGYSKKVVSKFPVVTRDADNPTAAAFRSAQPCELPGAVVTPLLTPTGCSGVLSIEMPSGTDPALDTRAAATIFASLFARFIEDEVSDRVHLLRQAAG